MRVSVTLPWPQCPQRLANPPPYVVQGEDHPEGALCTFQAWWLTYFGELQLLNSKA